MVMMAIIITTMTPMILYSFQFSSAILLFILLASLWNSYS